MKMKCNKMSLNTSKMRMKYKNEKGKMKDKMKNVMFIILRSSYLFHSSLFHVYCIFNLSYFKKHQSKSKMNKQYVFELFVFHFHFYFHWIVLNKKRTIFTSSTHYYQQYRNKTLQ